MKDVSLRDDRLGRNNRGPLKVGLRGVPTLDKILEFWPEVPYLNQVFARIQIKFSSSRTPTISKNSVVWLVTRVMSTVTVVVQNSSEQLTG